MRTLVPVILLVAAPLGCAHPPPESVVWPTTSGGLTLDDAVEERVSSLLAGMTLGDEVGQVLQANTTNITTDEVRQLRPGSILSGGNDGPGGRSCGSAGEWLPRGRRPGGVQFRGHSWLRSSTQVPLNVGDSSYDPLLAFGYGLTYAD